MSGLGIFVAILIVLFICAVFFAAIFIEGILGTIARMLIVLFLILYLVSLVLDIATVLPF